MIHIQALIDDEKCFATIRELRWPEGVRCPHCTSTAITKRGFHTHQAARERYQCQTCHQQFDDLTDTVFEGHHQPLRVWIVCLYFMGLNLSNQQIAAELELSPCDVHSMTLQLREGIVKKKAV